MTGTILGTGKIEKVPALMDLLIQSGETANEQISIRCYEFLFHGYTTLTWTFREGCSDAVTSRNMNKGKELGVWIMYRDDYSRWREQEGQRPEDRSTLGMFKEQQERKWKSRITFASL